jgi:hypothetical protein
VQRRITLLDEPYYSAMLRVRDAFVDEELPLCLVGGGAVQVWVASLRTGEGARRTQLSEEPVLRTALRKTRDLDFATRTDAATMLRVLNEIASHSGEAHVLGPRALRLGPVSLAFTIEPGDLSGMSEFYDVFLESVHELRLRRGPQVDEVPTIGLEQLIATKLKRRGDKAKDLIDVGELLASLSEAGRHLAIEDVRGLLRGGTEAIALLEELVFRTRESR